MAHSYDARTIAAYDAHAAAYEDRTATYWDRYPPGVFMQAFAAQALSNGNHVLDAGCGTGRDGMLLQKLRLSVFGIDASQEMTRRAAAKGLCAMRADFLRLPFKDGSFQGVWAYMSFLNVPRSSIRRAFAESRRVLCPGGALGLGMKLFSDASAPRASTLPDGRLQTLYAESDLIDHVERAGFLVTFTQRLTDDRDVYPYLHLIATAR